MTVGDLKKQLCDYPDDTEIKITADYWGNAVALLYYFNYHSDTLFLYVDLRGT